MAFTLVSPVRSVSPIPFSFRSEPPAYTNLRAVILLDVTDHSDEYLSAFRNLSTPRRAMASYMENAYSLVHQDNAADVPSVSARASPRPASLVD